MHDFKTILAFMFLIAIAIFGFSVGYSLGGIGGGILGAIFFLGGIIVLFAE